MLNAIDLFAGSGGWDLAAKQFGIDPLGIEWDDAACATREAAGLRTLQADVSQLDPVEVSYQHFEQADEVELVIASAPCPTFSSAGNGAGNHLIEIIVRCLHELAAGHDTRAERRQEAFEILRPVCWEAEQRAAKKKQREPDRSKADDRARRDADMSLLVVEPLRYILALEPRFIALEQVPGVLPLWSQMAQILGTLGYSTWTGIMEAERYGVPQTRERAILMADREGPVHPPRPTHQRYVKGEPQRHEVTLEGEVLPWVSMAEALGWLEGDQPSPAPTVSGGGTAQGGGIEDFAGSHARRRVDRAVVATGANSQQADGGVERYERPISAPAPCLDSKVGKSWKVHNLVYDRRAQNSDGSPVPPVPASQPAPTLTANGLAKSTHQWVAERPSTAVCGDPRISPPGYRGGKSEYAELEEGEAPKRSGGQDAIRITLEEALILQSFPPDYPVQGTKSQRFLQIGNAVPPLLALAILCSLLEPVLAAVPASTETEGVV